jgi:hypothetical protein
VVQELLAVVAEVVITLLEVLVGQDMQVAVEEAHDLVLAVLVVPD